MCCPPSSRPFPGYFLNCSVCAQICTYCSIWCFYLWLCRLAALGRFAWWHSCCRFIWIGWYLSYSAYAPHTCISPYSPCTSILNCCIRRVLTCSLQSYFGTSFYMPVATTLIAISTVCAAYYPTSIEYTLLVFAATDTAHQRAGSLINWLHSWAVLIGDIVLSICISASSSARRLARILSSLATAPMCAILLFTDPAALLSMSIFITCRFLIYNCY